MVIVDIHLGRLGIIEGDAKRLLEPYVDGRLFSQRKTYDEYYVQVPHVKVKIDIKDLFIMSEKFIVNVGNGWVELEEIL